MARQAHTIRIGATAGMVAVAASVAAAGTAIGTAAAAPLPAESTDIHESASRRELVDEVRRLQARVAELERRLTRPDSTLTRPDSSPTPSDHAAARRADRALAETQAQTPADDAQADVLADARRRSQFMAMQGFTAGYSGGRFVVQSEDGNFVFSPAVLAQLRYVANWADDAQAGSGPSNGGPADGDAAFDSGFEVRRLRLMFDGNVLSPSLTYFFQWNTGVNGGGLVLDQAWVRYAFAGTPFAVRFGAYVNGWDHETAVNIGKQLAVDRSVPNTIFATGLTGVENYVQGVELQYQAVDDWRASVMIHEGMLTRNTDFRNEVATAPAIGIVNPDGGAAGRFEYKLAGDWRDYADFTARGTRKDLLVVGGGFNIDTADNLNSFMYTVDAQWEPASVAGLSVYAAFIGMHREFGTVAAGQTGSPNDWGMVAQAGYLLSPTWEVFGRYSFTRLDDGGPGTLGDAARVNDTIHELTAGVNYYFLDHAAKFSLDATYLPEGSPLNMPGIGIVAQESAEPQAVVRAQFQLAI